MKKTSVIILMIMLSGLTTVKAEDWRRLQSLKGNWLFSIGDDINWSKVSIRDENWESIRVPSSWENEGFNGYNGYAWYRKHFSVNKNLKEKVVFLRLGRVDDVDEVYLNGNLIGSSGTFPPNYETAYYAWREYYVPSSYLNYNGDNVLAVRVYDSEMEGGIIEGDVALFEDRDGINLNYNLSGVWNFRTGDDLNWKENAVNDKAWVPILVPGFWETQGFSGYDGFAWYRKQFTPPSNLSGKKLVLYLGKIDDIDEVYLNGKRIGSTGHMNKGHIDYDTYGEYAQIRGYYIPDGLLQFDQKNTIAVRVYDGFKDGGIYQGPVGLVEQSEYNRYLRSNRSKDKQNFWEWLFD